jgi:CheY-like chemotaxis protein
MVPVPDTGRFPVQVLVVEDETLIRNLLTEELIETGFQVIEASTAVEALAYIEAGGGVDVVVTDVHLPGPLNGLDVAQYFRRSFPEIPVIITAGNLGTTVIEGLGEFLPKPYTPLQAVGLVVQLTKVKS